MGDSIGGARELEGRLEAVRARIAAACERAGRDPSSVRLIAVTKTFPPEAVASAASAGVAEFGENYVTELEAKRRAAPGARWHFLGRLQSNKVARIAAEADVIHTLEPGRAADRLARIGRERGSPVRALIEVDFTGRRVGVDPKDVPSFLEDTIERGGVDVAGLMTVAPSPSDRSPRNWFADLRKLRESLHGSHPQLSELSMGMSADLDEAVEEGATMVRVGSAIFGPRP